MKEIVEKYLDRAESALDSAELLLAGHQSHALANRAYYAVFYCVSALLITENVMTKTHQASRARFGELFIKTDRFPKEASKMLNRCFNARQSADYDIDAELEEAEAVELLTDARAFYQLTLDYFAQHPPVDTP